MKDRPLKGIDFQRFRDAVWNPEMPASYPHGMDCLLVKIEQASFKELVSWSLNWLMLIEHEQRMKKVMEDKPKSEG